MTKLEAVMAENRRWQEILKLKTVADLNKAVRLG
jgi:hypothetical protein